jgi:hypothetical protein
MNKDATQQETTATQPPPTIALPTPEEWALLRFYRQLQPRDQTFIYHAIEALVVWDRRR